MKTLFNAVVILAGIAAVKYWLNSGTQENTNNKSNEIELVGTWDDFDDVMYAAYCEGATNG